MLLHDDDGSAYLFVVLVHITVSVGLWHSPGHQRTFSAADKTHLL
jgi:hypothetical protein